MKTETHTNSEADLAALQAEGALCVIHSNGEEGVGVMVYDRDGRSELGTQIRTYRPGQWDGPVLTTAVEVFEHLSRSDKPCSMPVVLANALFNWGIPFAPLPG